MLPRPNPLLELAGPREKLEPAEEVLRTDPLQLAAGVGANSSRSMSPSLVITKPWSLFSTEMNFSAIK